MDDEDGNPGEQSLAITARSLRRKVTPGTVVAAECCYGAQLFDSSNVRNPLVQRDFAEAQWPTRGKAGIALEYLRQGALGFFVVSKGGGVPWRMKIRSPSFCNLSILHKVLLEDMYRLPGTYSGALVVDEAYVRERLG